MIGKQRLTEKDKEVLRGMVKHTCQNCKEHEFKVGKLIPHRIIRGCDGGLYSPNNLLLVCKDCHGLLHGCEFK